MNSEPNLAVKSGKEATQFKKGNPGKQQGTQNRLTRTVKETVLSVFNEIQSDPEIGLTAFAKKYPRDFYQIAARLIPTDIKADIRLTKVTLEIVRTTTAQIEHPASASAEGN